jgi:hypothetical protein
VSGFNRIRLSGSGELMVRQGDSEGLEVRTDDNIMKYIKTHVRNSTLYLEVEAGKSISPTRLTYTLDLIDLHSVDVTGSGKFTMNNLDSEDLWIDISGSGRVDIDTLTAKSAHIDISGSGRVSLAGTAPHLDINVGGSGNVVIDDLRCERADVEVSGSGRVTLWASDSLDGKITGSGTVNYFGDPETDVSVSGSGDFNYMGDK